MHAALALKQLSQQLPIITSFQILPFMWEHILRSSFQLCVGGKLKAVVNVGPVAPAKGVEAFLNDALNVRIAQLHDGHSAANGVCV